MSRALLITCFSFVSALLLLSLALYCYASRTKSSRKHDHSRSLKDYSWNVTSFQFLNFRNDDIINAIKEENMIGRGSSGGEVYRVSLENGVTVAVKHIRNTADSLEFATEVEMLSSIRPHENVVKLYCSITSQHSSLLVYEYMPNGSLWDLLHSSGVCGIDLKTRYEIAIGAAKGLAYLHHDCARPVIHRDVKSGNILLDEHLKPRLAGFGFAKVADDATGGGSTLVVVGTDGYRAPDYAFTSRVNEKSDVYSFGVVLMELVMGRKPLEARVGESSSIVDWVCSKRQTEESLSTLVDPSVHGSYKEEAVFMLVTAKLCTSSSPNDRPTMREVVQALEKAKPRREVM